jgi:hypothetical protein
MLCPPPLFVKKFENVGGGFLNFGDSLTALHILLLVRRGGRAVKRMLRSHL